MVRAYGAEDVAAMREIWNAVVEDAQAFPQLEPLGPEAALRFFAAQSYCGVAEALGAKAGNAVAGLYILHPNNVGRCGHIANASYAVAREVRGQGLGAALITDSLAQAKRLGFTLMQFNAVVAENAPALHLYEKLGFTRLGTIPGGFHRKDGFSDIVLFYKSL